MAKGYDIVARLQAKNERPFIKISEDLVVEVDNSKTTALKFMAIERDDKLNEIEKLDKLMVVAVGKKSFEKIEKLNLTFPAYNVLFEAVSAAFSGEDLEEVKDRFQKDKN